MCGGPSERKCCLSSGSGGDNGGNGPLPEFNVGDIYWYLPNQIFFSECRSRKVLTQRIKFRNHYGGYALSRYATSTGYSYGTLKVIILSDIDVYSEEELKKLIYEGCSRQVHRARRSLFWCHA